LILEALRGAPEGMTRHEIRRGLFADHKPAATVASKLALLLQLGLVRSASEPRTGGRPAERWFSSGLCVKSVVGVKSPPDTAPDHLDALATEAAAESLPASPPAKGTPRPAVAAPPVPAEWHPIIARLPVAWRNRWAERAAMLQAAGLPRDIAQDRALRWTVEEMGPV
jgi:hypothetical protein